MFKKFNDMKVYQVYQTIVLKKILQKVLLDSRFLEDLNLSCGTIVVEQINDIIANINVCENVLKYKDIDRLTAVKKADKL